jgi:catechol 2,3-dioxygenase-like lactoylglutathione lyase family enzyme
MKHHLTGLDHPVIAVRDMEAARATFERLGFIVPPRGHHPDWGTGNWCIQFAREYLELRGFIQPSDAPQTRELLAFLARREGLMGIAFGTTGARLSHDAFVASGLHPRPVKPLTRNFELPEGTVPVSFELCFLPREETPALMHVVVCEHLTPERLRRPEWLQHANGARRVAGLVAVAEDPLAALAAWDRLFSCVRQVEGGIQADVGNGWLLLLGPADLRRRYPGVELPSSGEWPCLAAIVLGVDDLEQTRTCLAGRGVACDLGARVIVPPAEACGTLLEFTPSPRL